MTSQPNVPPLSRGHMRNRATPSQPLVEVQFYRPSPSVALAILLFPVVVTLVGAIVFLNTTGAIPIWLPFLMIALWILCLPAFWLVMQSARTTTHDFATGRPLRPWTALSWDTIERVEQSGFSIRATASDGRHITFTPFLLRDGARLRREFLLRLPQHILTGTLTQEANKLITSDIQTRPGGGLSGTLHVRPRLYWRNLFAGIGGILLIAGIGVIFFLGGTLGAVIGAGCIIIGLGSLALFAWLLQEVRVSEKGLSRTTLLHRHATILAWEDMELIEHSSREYILRLRGSQRFICAGPALLPAAERDLMRAYIHEYGIEQGVPIVRRAWIIV